VNTLAPDADQVVGKIMVWVVQDGRPTPARRRSTGALAREHQTLLCGIVGCAR
jgi:hypothetical protein